MRLLCTLVLTASACLVTLQGDANELHAAADPGAAGPGAAGYEACDADCQFAAGYLEAGGPELYLRHLIEDVRPCEGQWGIDYAGVHVSAFQFDRGSWATASSHTGATDPLDPYSVGVNVAWWIVHIDDPGSSAGWPVCWNRR